MNLYESHPLLAIPLQLVLTAVVGLYAVSFIGGWWSLSRKFTTDRPMPPNSFLASGTFRLLARYNNILQLGGDAEGLYLRFWPRLAHPPLFIPWNELRFTSPRRVLFFRVQTLVLADDLQIPFTISKHNADRLQDLANSENTSMQAIVLSSRIEDGESPGEPLT